jgi:hypothetical protein
MLEGKNCCAKLNDTDSAVFQEFENFLKNEVKVQVQPFQPFPDSKITTGDCAIPELA